jgi:CheY-like chemotaxis protein
MNNTRPILLVEDNPMDVDLTQRTFARQNLSNPLEVARDGQEALEWLPRWEHGEQLPMLVLLDLKLPKVDGIEVLRQLKRHPHFSILPVVVLTSSKHEQDIQTAYQLGVNSYIVKPVDYDYFMDVATQIERYWLEINVSPA